MSLLEVDDLRVRFHGERGIVRAVDGLSYRVESGECVGLVGESGAGKSVAALALLGLLDGADVDGEVRYRGEDLLDAPPDRLREVRGDEVGLAPQDPDAALNPVYAVGDQVAEAVRAHRDLADGEAERRAVELLDRVGLDDPESRYASYPHELSGGQKQRVVLAVALSSDPSLVVCDEPTSALDVTVQAEILDLLADVASGGTAVLLVTHDVGVVATACDRVVVAYAGRTVETAPVEDLFYDPQHPYTAGLLAAAPRLGDDRERLPTIPGSPPDEFDVPPGCPFHPRCPYAEDVCTRRDPPLVDPATGEAVDPTAAERAAACLAHTGDLDGDLEYAVEVREDSP